MVDSVINDNAARGGRGGAGGAGFEGSAGAPAPPEAMEATAGRPQAVRFTRRVARSV